MRRALLLAAFVFVFYGQRANADISYTISLDNPESHLFHVTVNIPGVQNQELVQMPAWNATYQIRDFASRIQDLRATNDKGAALRILKLDKQTWRITGSGNISVQYAIFWDESSPFSSQLNAAHAFMNLAEILAYVPDRRAEHVYLGILFAATAGRGIATALTAMGVTNISEHAIYNFFASSYDVLVDAPVEVGNFQEFDLPGISPPVHVVVHGDDWDKQQLSDGLSKIVRYYTQMMGGAPYTNYTFILHIGPNSFGGGGGMEHANSTAIGAQSVAGALNLASHEFFHAWNVKRIRPQTLEPVDYTKEMYTRALWFAEGVTSTYSAFARVRTGLWNATQFYSDLGEQISELQSRPAHTWQSVEESSLNAWLEKYNLYNQPDFSISYYNKGQLIGDMLDILIRDATDNRESLDDVLRSLNDNFAKKGRFYNDSADIEATVENASGKNFHNFFARYVAGTDEVPFTDMLAKAGLALEVTSISRATAGLDARPAAGGAMLVTVVDPGGGAQTAGIRPGDILVAINGEAASFNTLAALSRRHPGDLVTIRIRRGNEESDHSVSLSGETLQEYRVEESRDANEQQRRILRGILTGTTN
jgi:predicted metalloprotease with PDZ domain